MDINKTISSMKLEDKARLCIDAALWRTLALSEYQIPVLNMSDGSNGLRYLKGQRDVDPAKYVFRESIRASLDTEEGQEGTSEATCFPTGSALACSWDIELAEEIAEAVANECKGYGVGMLFGPAMNTRRHPLDGRGFEYLSEDPILAGELAGHYVKGLQSHDVAGCLKHFACNNTNYMRSISDSIVEERALREIYLAAFERAIETGKPAAIMSSYNLLNGIQASENPWLLTEVLRDEWGFDGMVISDSSAIKDPVKAFKAGLDWQMPFSKMAADALVKAVKDGEMAEKEIDVHCQRILQTVNRYNREGKTVEKIDFDAHHALAQKAAAECAVLLKNEDKILPIDTKTVKKIAVLGDTAQHPVFQGSGCACVPARTVDDTLEEIRRVCPADAQILYEQGYLADDSTNEAMLNQAVQAAEEADIAIVFAAARLPLEDDDYNRRDMKLIASHGRLVEEVAKRQKNAIVVLNHGEPVEMPWISSVKAVLDMNYGGEGVGRATADILFGKKNPCGRTSVTFPIRLEDTPGYLNFPGENHQMIYEEGIFVGYRYYEKKKVEPLFPFGFGLSYTTFAYSDLRISKKQAKMGEILTVAVTVKNTGALEGAEVVQCYIRDDHARLKRPEKELKHFAKIILKPGESREISFALKERDFAYYDPFFGGWKVDTGNFEILIGSSSADIKVSGNVNIQSEQVYQPPIRTDMHFGEVFANEVTRDIFYDFLIELEEILPEDRNEENDNNFLSNFWGIAQYLDYMLPMKVTPEMVEELVEKMQNAVKK